jgi:hypothetical protein
MGKSTRWTAADVASLQAKKAPADGPKKSEPPAPAKPKKPYKPPKPAPVLSTPTDKQLLCIRNVKQAWEAMEAAKKLADKEAKAKLTESFRASVCALFAAYGLPMPEFEYKFHPDRNWRLDVFLRKERLGFEIDGGIFRGGGHTGAGHAEDFDKANHAMFIHGITTLHFLPPSETGRRDTLMVFGTHAMMSHLQKFVFAVQPLLPDGV